MSRSCHRATFSSAASAFVRTRRARPHTCSQETGLRLCGIALEPFWPAVNGSSTSRISVRWSERISSRDLLERGGHDRQGGRELGVAIPLDDLGGDRARARGRAAGTLPPRRRDPRGRTCRPRPTSCPPAPPRAPAGGAPGCGRPPRTRRAALSPNVVGSAWMPCVRPTHGVSRVRRARLRTRPGSRSSRPAAPRRPPGAGAPARCPPRPTTSGPCGRNASRPRAPPRDSSGTRSRRAGSWPRSRRCAPPTPRARPLMRPSASAGISPRRRTPRTPPARPGARRRTWRPGSRCAPSPAGVAIDHRRLLRRASDRGGGGAVPPPRG